jgi:hypothetical protein
MMGGMEFQGTLLLVLLYLFVKGNNMSSNDAIPVS